MTRLKFLGVARRTFARGQKSFWLGTWRGLSRILCCTACSARKFLASLGHGQENLGGLAHQSSRHDPPSVADPARTRNSRLESWLRLHGWKPHRKFVRISVLIA